MASIAAVPAPPALRRWQSASGAAAAAAAARRRGSVSQQRSTAPRNVPGLRRAVSDNTPRTAADLPQASYTVGTTAPPRGTLLRKAASAYSSAALPPQAAVLRLRRNQSATSAAAAAAASRRAGKAQSSTGAATLRSLANTNAADAGVRYSSGARPPAQPPTLGKARSWGGAGVATSQGRRGSTSRARAVPAGRTLASLAAGPSGGGVVPSVGATATGGGAAPAPAPSRPPPRRLRQVSSPTPVVATDTSTILSAHAATQSGSRYTLRFDGDQGAVAYSQQPDAGADEDMPTLESAALSAAGAQLLRMGLDLDEPLVVSSLNVDSLDADTQAVLASVGALPTAGSSAQSFFADAGFVHAGSASDLVATADYGSAAVGGHEHLALQGQTGGAVAGRVATHLDGLRGNNAAEAQAALESYYARQGGGTSGEAGGAGGGFASATTLAADSAPGSTTAPDAWETMIGAGSSVGVTWSAQEAAAQMAAGEAAPWYAMHAEEDTYATYTAYDASYEAAAGSYSSAAAAAGNQSQGWASDGEAQEEEDHDYP